MTKAGDGELVLTADASSSPNIDKFVITAKEVSAATYKITATAGESMVRLKALQVRK